MVKTLPEDLKVIEEFISETQILIYELQTFDKLLTDKIIEQQGKKEVKFFKQLQNKYMHNIKFANCDNEPMYD